MQDSKTKLKIGDVEIEISGGAKISVSSDGKKIEIEASEATEPVTNISNGDQHHHHHYHYPNNPYWTYPYWPYIWPNTTIGPVWSGTSTITYGTVGTATSNISMASGSVLLDTNSSYNGLTNGGCISTVPSNASELNLSSCSTNMQGPFTMWTSSSGVN